jgi:hypothetical protein
MTVSELLGALVGEGIHWHLTHVTRPFATDL